MSQCTGSVSQIVIIVVVIVMPQPPRGVLYSLTPFLRQLTIWSSTKDVPIPNFPEGRAEFLNAESVHDGIDGGVAVG